MGKKAKKHEQIALDRLDGILNECGDIEADHIKADEVLCQLLISLGYEAVVEKWQEIPKWYA